MAKSGYCTIAQDSQSIINNTSTIIVKGIITTSGVSYRGDSRTGTITVKQGSTTIYSGSFTHGAPANSTTTLFSVTLTVSHDSSGKSGTITASYNYDDGWCTGSGSLSLTQIKRASVPTLSENNVKFGETITIYTNRQTDTFYHHLYYSINDGEQVGLHGYVLDSFDWTVPLNLMDKIPNATSATIKFRLYTFTSENVNIGNNTITFTATVPSDVKPSCTLNVTDAEGYEDVYGVFVQGWSKFKIDVEAESTYSSEIASYKVTADGKAYTSASVTTELLLNSGELDIVASVTDKRGRTGSALVEKTVLEYNAPNISLMKVLRCDSDGTENDQGEYVKVTLSATATALNDKNTVAYKLEYKKSSDSEYTSVDLSNLANAYTVTESEVIFAADSGSSYDVRMTITDAFGTTSKATVVSTGYTLFHCNKSGRGFSFGKVSEKDALEIAMDMYDKFDTQISNGLVVENESVDIDTTLEHLVKTNVNTPMGTDIYMYIFTVFSVEKAVTSDRAQIAIPCVEKGSVYHRYYTDGVWSDWRRCVNEDELSTKADSDMIKRVGFSAQVTVKANSFGMFNLGEVSAYSGYTFIGFIPLSGGYGDQWVCSFTYYRSKCYASIHSCYGYDLTATVSCYALYMKN